MKLTGALLVIFTIATMVIAYLFVADKMFKHFDFVAFIILSIFFILLDININKEGENNFGEEKK